MIRLRVELADSVREYTFHRSQIRIGRSPMNDLAIPEAEVSARHATLQLFESGKLVFTDLDSLSGSAVLRGEDEETVEGPHDVATGDVIRLAESVRLVLLSNEATPARAVTRLELDKVNPAALGAVFAGRLAHFALNLARDARPRTFLAGVRALVSSPSGADLRRVLLFKTNDGAEPEHLLELDLHDNGQVRPAAVGGCFSALREQVMEAFAEPGLVHHSLDEDAVRLFIVGELSHEPGALSLCVELETDELDEDEVEYWAILAAQLAPLIDSLTRATRQRRREAHLRAENQYFRDRQRRHYLFKELVAESDAMRAIYKQLSTFVDQSAPVLITGEAGTGKELIARALHHLGERSSALMVAQNVADIDEVVLDAELFGAVSGAHGQARLGTFELAHGGTVYLGEIDRLTPILQGKLLRVIKEGEIRRHGEEQARAVDVRLVMSTHRSLPELISRGEFRKDLHVAIGEHIIEVPPLRERREDILPLAEIFLGVFSRRYGVPRPEIPSACQPLLLDHPWPGNVRELQTVLESVVLKNPGRELRPEDFGLVGQ